MLLKIVAILSTSCQRNHRRIETKSLYILERPEFYYLNTFSLCGD